MLFTLVTSVCVGDYCEGYLTTVSYSLFFHGYNLDNLVFVRILWFCVSTIDTTLIDVR